MVDNQRGDRFLRTAVEVALYLAEIEGTTPQAVRLSAAYVLGAVAAGPPRRRVQRGDPRPLLGDLAQRGMITAVVEARPTPAGVPDYRFQLTEHALAWALRV